MVRDLDLDLGSGHTAYRRASLIDLYLHAKFHWNQRTFLWTDGRTFETHFIASRSTQKSRPKTYSREDWRVSRPEPPLAAPMCLVPEMRATSVRRMSVTSHFLEFSHWILAGWDFNRLVMRVGRPTLSGFRSFRTDVGRTSKAIERRRPALMFTAVSSAVGLPGCQTPQLHPAWRVSAVTDRDIPGTGQS